MDWRGGVWPITIPTRSPSDQWTHNAEQACWTATLTISDAFLKSRRGREHIEQALDSYWARVKRDLLEHCGAGNG